jgi:hypothetical protein
VPEISRRAVLAVLGAGALAAGSQYAVDAAMPVAGAQPGEDQQTDNPVRAENREPGSTGWKIGAEESVASDDLGRQIKGYLSATSVDLGETVDFHVSTQPARPFTVAVFRLGDYGGVGARRMAVSPTLPGVSQPDPAVTPETGTIHCSWSASWALTVPRHWTSGAYLAVFTTVDGHRSYAPFVVRDDARRSDFLVVLPFSTYQAYNQWPLDGRTGKSLYYGYGRNIQGTGPEDSSSTRTDVHGVPVDYGTRARAVSFARPYSGVGLPQRADLDYDFLQWAERVGYDMTYASSVDLHQGRIDASRHAALVFSGHDEYWSRTMRETVSDAVDRGTHVAFMAANNVYWHVRFDAEHLMACWKSDPDPSADGSGPTRLWRTIDAKGEQSEQGLIGVQYNGIPKAEMPLVVQNAEHWLWAGTGVRDGEKIPGIVGGEADGFDAAAPQPASVNHTLLSASHYMALGGNDWPRIQHTSLYETERGAVVFAAGTFNWVLGLNRRGYADARIQRATENLFNRLRKAPVPAS